MKKLPQLFTVLVAFSLATNGNSQIDFEKYKPIDLPTIQKLEDSLDQSNEAVVFRVKESSFKSNNQNQKLLNINSLPSSKFTQLSEEMMNESKQFSNLVPADQIGVLTDYPIRTVVKLYIDMYNPVSGQTSTISCSGILVGDNEVLTAGHCVAAGGSDPSYANAITVVPAYNMGASPFGYTQMSQWISFTQWTDNGNWDYDIAMVQLLQPIGNNVGWLGFGYNVDNSFYTNPSNTFHSFGYPAQNDAGQTVFEGGERMYYMNGYIDYFESSNSMCHYNLGFKGQSGSGLYYNDNGNRFALGVLSHGSNQVPNTCHTRINGWMFNHFLDFMGVASLEEEVSSNVDIYPNPSTLGVFHLSFPEENERTVIVSNSMGQEILFIKTTSGKVSADLSAHPSGIYYCTIQSENGISTRKIIRE